MERPETQDGIQDKWKIADQLPGGVRCYIFENELPCNHGKLSLVVKVGLLCEERFEAGVAHLLEHVLVRAGAEAISSSFLDQFSSHEEHSSASTYTVFAFQVQQADEILEAIELFSLIANQKVRIEDSHIEVEKKIVTMEYKQHNNNSKKVAIESFRYSLEEGASSVKTCLDNLKNINSTIVNDFYHKWYIPSQMALLITGNFDTKELLDLAQRSFHEGKPGMTLPTIARSHWTPGLRISDAVKRPTALVFKPKRTSDLHEIWGRRMMVNATNRRLKQSIEAYAFVEEIGSNTFIVLASYTDVNKPIYEFLRLKEWGLTSAEIERELGDIKKEMKQEAALFHLDKHHQINVFQRKFLNHFLYDDKITTPDSDVKPFEAENSLQNLAHETLKLLEVEQAVIYLKELSFSSVKSLIEDVQKQHLVPWEDTRKPINFDQCWKCESQVPQSMKHLKKIDMHELDLSNGMRVLLCRSDVPYKCEMKGFAYGGLSQQVEEEYLSSYVALGLVKNLPSFPLNYDLIGRENLTMRLHIQDYIRSFTASFDTSELNVALQIIYLLFCEKPTPTKADLQQALNSLEQNGITSHKVFECASEPSFLHKRPIWKDIRKVDVCKALAFFSECFLDPSQFTVVLTGDFDVEMTAKSVQKYLGSIPPKTCTAFPIDRRGLKTFHINFPQGVVDQHNFFRIQSFIEVFLCVPLKMAKEQQDEDEARIDILKAMVLRRLNSVLRCEMGEVYNVSASALFDGKTYASPRSEEAILLVKFCYDDERSIDLKLLTEKALKEIEDLQSCLSLADLACLQASVKPYKLRSSILLQEAINAYQAKDYQGDVEETILERRKMLRKISASQDIPYWKTIIGRMMPYKYTERHAVVTFHTLGKCSENYSEEEESYDEESLEEEESDDEESSEEEESDDEESSEEEESDDEESSEEEESDDEESSEEEESDDEESSEEEESDDEERSEEEE